MDYVVCFKGWGEGLWQTSLGESVPAYTDTEPKGWMRHEWKLGALRLEGNVVTPARIVLCVFVYVLMKLNSELVSHQLLLYQGEQC